MSEEENETLETKVALSRLTKQDYLIHCIEQRDYVIDGKNTRVWKVLKQQLDVFIQRFSEIDDISELGNDELDVLEYMLQIILAIKKEARLMGNFIKVLIKMLISHLLMKNYMSF